MPDESAENPAPGTIGALFAERVARRDVLAPPPPPSQTPAAIAARLGQWLLRTHHQTDVRPRTCLAQMLLLLLQQPEASTAALHTAGGVGPRSGSRATGQLAGWGLLEWHRCEQRIRYFRLTRAGEDALLPVVTGVAG